MVMAAVRRGGGADRRALCDGRAAAEEVAEALAALDVTTRVVSSSTGASMTGVAAAAGLGGVRFGRCFVLTGRFGAFFGTEAVSPGSP